MKTLLTALSLLLILGTPAFANTGYISDLLIVTVRAQPGKGQTVLTTVRTGAPLEILEELEGFLHVRTAEGVEGYVPRQYVTGELPKAEQIKQLKTENDQLLKQVDELSASLSGSRNRAVNLDSTEKELARIKGEYQALQKSSAGVLRITRERDQLLQENSDLTERMQQLKEENNLYLRTAVIKWFLAGAGVLFFGWFLGKISRKKKRNYM
jgi:SH3 domain protein